MPVQDGWNWPQLLYIGTVLLKMPERLFWATLPCKLHALLEQYSEIRGNKGSSDETAPAYIDQII